MTIPVECFDERAGRAQITFADDEIASPMYTGTVGVSRHWLLTMLAVSGSRFLRWPTLIRVGALGTAFGWRHGAQSGVVV